MNQRTLSLTDILHPPANEWLAQLARGKTGLPAGVRVVRFSEKDDDDFDTPRGTPSVRHEAK
jgi:hypothetical protein